MFLSSVKEKWMIFSNFVAFSEYMNFKFCNLQDFFPKFKSRVHKGVFKKNVTCYFIKSFNPLCRLKSASG
jgi:hypothetical protein